MDKYRINTHEDFLNNPIHLYEDVYVNSIPKLSKYKFLDLKFSNEYTISVISDIHADFKRFLNFLKINSFVDDTFSWNPIMNKKIIVICGDFIDGYRNRDNLNLGKHNEISLLKFIYNLRLEAIKYDSYIFCTLGNHDYFCIHPLLNNERHTYAYLDYIDSNSIKYYLDDSPFKNKNINDFDLLFFTRAYYLSRFYLLGYHFFLKINDTIFAHAGFHKNRETFEKFTANSTSNFNLSPMLFHRKILEKLSQLETYNSFFNRNTNDNYTYNNLYNFIVDSIIKKYEIERVFNRKNMINQTKLLKNVNSNSILNNFFLTREIRKDCLELENILSVYDCNLLVVGHCPTCSFNEISCDDARIVFNCGSKLSSVDIAFSSAFSPNKKFLEYLHIYTKNNNKHIAIHRTFKNSIKNIYDEHIFSYKEDKWIPQ